MYGRVQGDRGLFIIVKQIDAKHFGKHLDPKAGERDMFRCHNFAAIFWIWSLTKVAPVAHISKFDYVGLRTWFTKTEKSLVIFKNKTKPQQIPRSFTWLPFSSILQHFCSKWIFSAAARTWRNGLLIMTKLCSYLHLTKWFQIPEDKNVIRMKWNQQTTKKRQLGRFKFFKEDFGK